MSPARLPLEGAYLHAFQARVALEVKGITLFRRNTGLIKLDKRVFRAGLPGQCDLYGISNGGRHFEVECKRFGKLSPAQRHWRDWCMDRGVPWMLLEVRRGELEAVTINRWCVEFESFLGVYVPRTALPPAVCAPPSHPTSLGEVWSGESRTPESSLVSALRNKFAAWPLEKPRGK